MSPKTKKQSTPSITRTVNTAVKPTTPVLTTEQKYVELKDLSHALVAEIDNIFASSLKSDHREQLLGTVLSAFAKELRRL